MIIGVELKKFGADLKLIILDSDNKHVFKQSSYLGVDDHWCRYEIYIFRFK